MKKIFNSKYSEAIILTVASCINILLAIILYSTKLLPDWGGKSLWNTGTLENYEVENGPVIFKFFSTLLIVGFFTGVALMALSLLLLFLKKKRAAFFIYLPYNIVLNLILLFFHVGLNFLKSGAFACIIISVVISSAQLIFTIIKHILTKEYNEETPKVNKSKISVVYKTVLLVCQILTTVLALCVFFIPLYKVVDANGDAQVFKLFQALSISFLEKPFPVTLYISFLVLFVLFIASLLFFVSNIQFFFKSDKIFVKKSKQYIYCNVVFLLGFFLLGYILCFIENLQDGNATTLSYIPLVCSLVILIAFSALQGKMGYGLEGENIKTARKLKIESLIYIFLLTCITFLSLLLNMIEMHVEIGTYKQDVAFTGYKLLTTYGELGEGLQALAFVLFAVLLTSGALFIFTTISYFTKYKDYDKVVKTTAITNAVFVLLIGLSGIYFKIAQAINAENLESILKFYNVTIPPNVEYTYTVNSKTIYMFIASFVILLVMLIRGQFSPEKLRAASPYYDRKDYTTDMRTNERSSANESAATASDFDACPAFTELDSKIELFNGELANRRSLLFENLTLPDLVRFVVDYARECRLHLSYSVEDIATFVAGLGASRLTILQGMSGTGKTSLPKIFAEAIMGNCEIVEIESSWRDKNELLGYYNEFSKCFTPKKFTQCLYKAKLNSAVPTFIVLDEMNLSRIEYYFSDFLSLMEHEEDKREIKLLNVKLYRTENGVKLPYTALSEGHTIKIPSNVWFIGTANRDESTFEISDKVYDRAQTMNFYKRAPKIQSFSQPLTQ
ncbi:MAG: AAA family ATPase, partial [Clostridia bacterium]|nr:AAA family ATPase [Clostridia bacterium]